MIIWWQDDPIAHGVSHIYNCIYSVDNYLKSYIGIINYFVMS